MRTFVLPPGEDPENAANWRTTRALRHHEPRLDYKTAKDLGWKFALRPAKHVYATQCRPLPQTMAKGIADTRPYPAPRPYLKRERT